MLLVGVLGNSWACSGVSEGGVKATPSQHSVALSWTASTSSNVKYNIYRALYTNACGSFSKINDSEVPETSYTDSNVINAESYCYGVKAAASNGQESDYSNIVINVRIPPQ